MNDNIPAGAQYDSRAPWNQEEIPHFRVITNEYWEGDESKGFEVILIKDVDGFDDELELWYNYDIGHNTVVEYVDDYNAESESDAYRFFESQVDFYTNEYDKDNG